MLAAVTGEYVRGAARHESEVHPFRKHFEDLQVGDSLLTHRRTVGEADRVRGASRHALGDLGLRTALRRRRAVSRPARQVHQMAVRVDETGHHGPPAEVDDGSRPPETFTSARRPANATRPSRTTSGVDDGVPGIHQIDRDRWSAAWRPGRLDSGEARSDDDRAEPVCGDGETWE